MIERVDRPGGSRDGRSLLACVTVFLMHLQFGEAMGEEGQAEIWSEIWDVKRGENLVSPAPVGKDTIKFQHVHGREALRLRLFRNASF